MDSSQVIVHSLHPVLPALAMVGGACLLLVMGMFQQRTQIHERLGSGFAWTSLGFLLIIACWWTMSGSADPLVSESASGSGQNGLFRTGLLSGYGVQLACLAGCLIVALSVNLTPVKYPYEYHACLLFLLAGVIFVGASQDITTLYLGLEMISIPTIVLMASSRSDASGREATLKYFALSAFSSALFLLGVSYWFGLAGSTSINVLVTHLADQPSLMGRIAAGLVIAGLAFRVTAVPFHAYAPDVFVGSSLPVASMMATLPKVAGFLALAKFLGGDLLQSGIANSVLNLLVILSLISMTLGNFSALRQTSWRRVFAYSSIAHSGYLLLGLAAVLVRGGAPTPVMAYLVAYVVMTLGMFSGLAAVVRCGDRDISLDDMEGLFSQRPWLSAFMAICLLSLIGMPLTAGFWAKFFLLSESIASEHFWLRIGAVVMVINSAIAAVYYLGMLYRLYVSRQGQEVVNSRAKGLTSASLTCGICAVLTVLWFIVPAWM